VSRIDPLIARKAVEQTRAPVLTKASWRRRGSGALSSHDVLPAPVRSEWPTWAEPRAAAGPVLQYGRLLSSIGAASSASPVSMSACWGIAEAVDQVALLVERRLLEQVAAPAVQLDRVAVELGEITAIGSFFELCQGPCPMRSRA